MVQSFTRHCAAASPADHKTCNFKRNLPAERQGGFVLEVCFGRSGAAVTVLRGPSLDHLAQGMLEVAAIEGQLGLVEFLGQIALDRLFISKVADRHFLDSENMLGFAQVDLLHAEVLQLPLVAQHSNTGTEGLVRPQVGIAQCEVLAGKGRAELQGYLTHTVGVDILHQHIPARLTEADAQGGAGGHIPDGDVIELVLGMLAHTGPGSTGCTEENGTDADSLAGVLDILDGDVVELCAVRIQQAHQGAAMGGGDDIADSNIVNVDALVGNTGTGGLLLVDGIQGNRIVAGDTGDVFYSDEFTAVAQVHAVLVLHSAIIAEVDVVDAAKAAEGKAGGIVLGVGNAQVAHLEIAHIVEEDQVVIAAIRPIFGIVLKVVLRTVLPGPLAAVDGSLAHAQDPDVVKLLLRKFRAEHMDRLIIRCPQISICQDHGHTAGQHDVLIDVPDLLTGALVPMGDHHLVNMLTFCKINGILNGLGITVRPKPLVVTRNVVHPFLSFLSLFPVYSLAQPGELNNVPRA